MDFLNLIYSIEVRIKRIHPALNSNDTCMFVVCERGSYIVDIPAGFPNSPQYSLWKSLYWNICWYLLFFLQSYPQRRGWEWEELWLYASLCLHDLYQMNLLFLDFVSISTGEVLLIFWKFTRLPSLCLTFFPKILLKQKLQMRDLSVSRRWM